MTKLRRMNDDKPQCHQFVFLHGWGQSSRIWYQQHDLFQGHAHFPDLPGHGDSQKLSSHQWLEHLETQILDLTKGQPITLIGWSLGGQLAISLQQRLKTKCTISGLVLISTTSSFRQKSDWLHGCSDEVWQKFSDAVQEQDTKLMQRFFQMILHGDVLTYNERNSIAKEAINKDKTPTFDALRHGLELLSSLDLNHNLQHIDIPTLIIHGQQDIIVPVEAGQHLTQNIPHSESHIFQDCGHAPFLTHHAEFNTLLEQWCKKLSM